MPIAIDGRVTDLRPTVTLADFKVGVPVGALSMMKLANLAHWVRGRGRVLVPQHICRTRIDGTHTTVTHHYKVAPSGVAVTRFWFGEVQPVTAGNRAWFTVTVGGSSATFTTAVAYHGQFAIAEPSVAKTTTPTDLQFTISQGGAASDPFLLVSLSCAEVPRSALARAGVDLGLSLDSFSPRRPQFQSTSEGISALGTLTAALTTKRCGLVAAWCEDTIAVTSATYIDLFETAHRIVPSKDKAGDTTRTCNIDVWGYVSAGGTTGNVIAVDRAGAASATMAVSSTTPAWLGSVTKTFLCEDLTTSNGVPGGVYDTVQLQAKRTAGAGNVIVKGWVVYE